MDDLAGTMPLLVVLLVGVFAWHLTFSAARMDRLHHRVDSSRASLDAQLSRRAVAAGHIAALLDPPGGRLLADTASRAASDHDEAAQNALTRALHATLDDPDVVSVLRADPLLDVLVDDLAEACSRAQLARRFHNDAVAQAQRVRRKTVVRWARLAGHAPMPQMIEIDDRVPAGLSARARAPRAGT